MVATSLGHTMFGSRTTDPAKLPPCKDARDQQINRANYQAAIWRHSLAARPPVPSRQGNGWTVDGDILVDWTDSPAAPQAVLECVSCMCKKCTGARCSCKPNRLTCTGACRCDVDDCDNRPALFFFTVKQKATEQQTQRCCHHARMHVTNTSSVTTIR